MYLKNKNTNQFKKIFKNINKFNNIKINLKLKKYKIIIKLNIKL